MDVVHDFGLSFLQLSDQLFLALLVLVIDYLDADLLFELLRVFDPLAHAGENIFVLLLSNDAWRSQLLQAVVAVLFHIMETDFEIFQDFKLLADRLHLLSHLLVPLRHEVRQRGEPLVHFAVLVVQLRHFLLLGVLKVLHELVHLFDITLYCAVQAVNFLLRNRLALPDLFVHLLNLALLAVLAGQDSLSELLCKENHSFNRGLDRSWDIVPLIFNDKMVDLVDIGHQLSFHGFSRVVAVGRLHTRRYALPHLAYKRALNALLR